MLLKYFVHVRYIFGVWQFYCLFVLRYKICRSEKNVNSANHSKESKVSLHFVRLWIHRKERERDENFPTFLSNYKWRVIFKFDFNSNERNEKKSSIHFFSCDQIWSKTDKPKKTSFPDNREQVTSQWILRIILNF